VVLYMCGNGKAAEKEINKKKPHTGHLKNRR
jgi:hypothetical protein